MINLGFSSDITTFWAVHNNKPVINAMNKLNECRERNSSQIFDFSILYIKFPSNKLLMLINSVIDFCFESEKSNYMTVIGFGTC